MTFERDAEDAPDAQAGHAWLETAVAESAVAAEVREGASGAWAVVTSVGRHEPVAVRAVSRDTGLPVPVVAAVCGELRARGVLARERPVQLTPRGRAAIAPLMRLRALPASGAAGGASAHLVPPGLEALAEQLEQVAAAVPDADVRIDQTHCTVATKLRRALLLLEAGALTRAPLLLLGDDDLVSVALALVTRHVGLPEAMAQATVLDVDERVLGFIERELTALGAPAAELVRHDVRAPLPSALAGRFGHVATDPPYTLAGARLFTARAVSALRPGADGRLLLSFAAKDPDTALALDRLLVEQGLSTRALHRGFNEYVGAGILGGVSDLRELGATADTKPAIAGAYEGDLYTGESAPRTRRYRCMACDAVHVVGSDEAWETIQELKAAGCPACGETRFQPLARAER
jgi:predicted methyltransferase